jgi:putative membrane protein
VTKIKSGWIWFVVIVIYLVGLAGFMIPALHDLFILLIPANILFAFVILLSGKKKFAYKSILLFVICFLFGYFIELLGTKTGIIFGDYAYGASLGLKVYGVPLLIGVNWFFMMYTSLAVAESIHPSRWVQIIVAPLLMVLYDYFLEPFAMRYDMWTWKGNVVPLENYIAWYLCGVFLCSVAIWGKFDVRNRFAAGLFAVQVLFFITLFIWNKLG